jgi:hypothetical protein
MSIDAVLQHHNIKLFEETENAIFVREQLNRIRALLLDVDADKDMIGVIEYMIKENNQWINQEVEKDLLARKVQGRST